MELGLVEDKLFPQFGPFYKHNYGGGANMHIDELARFVNETHGCTALHFRGGQREKPGG